MDTAPVEIDTPHGPARAHVRRAEGPRGLLVLGHGAGGGVHAPDLVAAVATAAALGWSTALVEQPYRVAGRRAPAPARQLDAAWTAVLDHLVGGPGTPPEGDAAHRPTARLPLVVGGRSSGARVACRTATAVRAAAVLCLAFPLQTPGRPDRPSRLPELEAVPVPVLVVQGEKDPFGVPAAGTAREVVVVRGNHSLDRDLPAVRSAVGGWLEALTG